jgi:hypothetical protein
MSAIPASSSSLISKGLHDQIPGPGFACSKDKLPASMFKSPLAPAYRRNAVVVSSYAAESPTSSQPRATTVCLVLLPFLIHDSDFDPVAQL